jgi:DNA-binding CsgD family transcriptional regulator
MPVSTTTEDEVFQSVKRVCSAGYDSAALRVEIARHVERVVPADQSYFWMLDPDTGIINHGIARHPTSACLFSDFVGHCYPDDEATQVIDQGRAGSVIRSGCCPALAERMRKDGIHQDMRALFFTPQAFWGSWCILRGRTPAFTDREARFVERIAPHVSEGLRSAALLELTGQPEAPAEDAEADASSRATPGFLVLGPQGEIALRTPAAAPHLADLRMQGVTDDGEPPMPVLSVRGRLLRRQRGAADRPDDARLRARGRSGAWYVLRATLAEPDANGLSSILVAIEPVAPRDVAPFLFRLYGLTPREREVIRWVVRGEPTKVIAAKLGLSVHTVQDYLDTACEKIGVRGRKALVAKLFADGFAPGLEG